jgi:hypothetical protein
VLCVVCCVLCVVCCVLWYGVVFFNFFFFVLVLRSSLISGRSTSSDRVSWPPSYPGTGIVVRIVYVRGRFDSQR